MQDMMLKTLEEKQASKMALFQKAKEIVQNCQPQQGERKQLLLKRNRRVQDEKGMRWDKEGVQENKTCNIVIAEPHITTVPGGELSENQISVKRKD